MLQRLLLGLLLFVMLGIGTASADSHDPVIQAVEAWESIEWFTSNCEAGTLPVIPSTYSNRKVEGKGSIVWWSHRYQLKLFPRSEWSMGHPWDFSGMGENSKLGFGVYCVHVEVIKEPVDVKLVCTTQPRDVQCDDTRQLEVELSVGHNVVWVDEDAMSPGDYYAWFKCAGGERICWPARVSAVSFRPPTEREICQYLTEGRWC